MNAVNTVNETAKKFCGFVGLQISELSLLRLSVLHLREKVHRELTHQKLTQGILLN